MNDQELRVPSTRECMAEAYRELQMNDGEVARVEQWIAMAREIREDAQFRKMWTPPPAEAQTDRRTLHDVNGVVCVHGKVAVQWRSFDGEWWLHAEDGTSCDGPDPAGDPYRRRSQAMRAAKGDEPIGATMADAETPPVRWARTLHDVEGIVCAHGLVAIHWKDDDFSGWWHHVKDGTVCDNPDEPLESARRRANDADGDVTAQFPAAKLFGLDAHGKPGYGQFPDSCGWPDEQCIGHVDRAHKSHYGASVDHAFRSLDGHSECVAIVGPVDQGIMCGLSPAAHHKSEYVRQTMAPDGSWTSGPVPEVVHKSDSGTPVPDDSPCRPLPDGGWHCVPWKPCASPGGCLLPDDDEDALSVAAKTLVRPYVDGTQWDRAKQASPLDDTAVLGPRLPAPPPLGARTTCRNHEDMNELVYTEGSWRHVATGQALCPIAGQTPEGDETFHRFANPV